MKAFAVRSFNNPRLQQVFEAVQNCDVCIMRWRLEDGTEAMRIGLRLIVVEPSGRWLEQHPISKDVPVLELVAALRKSQ